MPKVKTAISLDQATLDQAAAIARDLKVSRSRVFSLGVEELARRLESRRLLRQINEAYDDVPDPEEVGRVRAMKRAHRRAIPDRW